MRPPPPPQGPPTSPTHGSGTVTAIDTATNTAGHADRGRQTFPIAVAITPDGATAYVTNALSDTVTPIDTATKTRGDADRRSETAPGGRDHPRRRHRLRHQLRLRHRHPDRHRYQHRGDADPGRRRPDGIAITPDGATAYVATFSSNTVTPIDTATNTAGTPIAVGDAPIGVAITPDGATAYVANRDSDIVTPIDTATNTAGTPIPVASAPTAIAITPDGANAYVTNAASATVTAIDTATNTAGTPITVGGPRRGSRSPPTAPLLTSPTLESDNVTPIDTATNTAGTAIAVGDAPSGIAIAPIAPPTISIDDVSQAEGDNGTTAFQFTVTLSDPAPAGGVTVDFETNDDTATEATDYTSNNGSLSLAAGESSKPVTVQVNGDFAIESDETFTVNLSNASGGVITDNQGQGAIENDDTAGFTVNSTADANDGFCTSSIGGCTLREAISSANSTAGAQRSNSRSPGAACLRFNDLGARGDHRPGHARRCNRESLTASGVPDVEIDGSLTTSATGIKVENGGTTIRGLVINRFDFAGVSLSGDSNSVQGNYLGTDPTGSLARGNERFGVIVGNSSLIGGTSAAARNVISANGETGIFLSGASNVIQGNYIGTDASGTADLGNDHGISGGSDQNNIGGVATAQGTSFLAMIILVSSFLQCRQIPPRGTALRATASEPMLRALPQFPTAWESC